MNIFQDTLRRIAERVEGTQAVSLIGTDGIPIDSYSASKDVALDSVAAQLGAFVKASERPGTGSETGSVEQITVVTEGSIAILSRVT